jgi:hypothetical protein
MKLNMLLGVVLVGYVFGNYVAIKLRPSVKPVILVANASTTKGWTSEVIYTVPKVWITENSSITGYGRKKKKRR